MSHIKNLTLGSLFDGIGGFPLAAQRFGIKTLWASEIEKNCISITKRHFPQMIHLGDITKIDGSTILPVDIIAFGSPCQDLSSSGRQEGLAGKRSGLFREAARIIYEMRCSTNGKYPTFIIWENVPGAFTSNKGQDFRTVLEEITKSRISMPVSGKWAKAGMVRTSRIEVAWRQLDAQYWGVPQRRKRIFLVADFGGKRASEILFKCEGLLGYSKKGGEKEKKNAAVIGNDAENAGDESIINFGGSADRIYINADTSRTIIASAGGLGAATGLYLVKQVYPIRDPTLNKGANGFVVGAMGAPAPTLSTVDRHAIAYFEAYQRNGYRQSDIAGTVTAGQNARIRGDTPVILKPKILGATDDNNKTISLLTRYVLRRLTPLECERLQGYPDDWTKYADTGEEIKDTPRYVALGNSLAIPCVERIFRGIVNVSNESRGDDKC